MKEVSNIKITAKKCNSKNEKEYLEVIFFKWAKNKYKAFDSVNIPVSDVPEIISKLQKALQSEQEEITQNSEDDGSKVDAEELKKNLKAYISSGERIKAAAKSFKSEYSESEKCLRKLQNSECYQKKLETHYEELEKIEEMYNLKIRDYMPIFNAVKEDWACFAGCVSENSFESLSASMFNKKSHMSRYVAKNMKLLDEMGDIPDFSEFETPSRTENQVDDGTLNLPEQYYKYVEIINSLMEYPKDVIEINGLSFEELSDICSQWEPYTDEINSMRKYFTSEKKRCMEKKCVYEEKYAECGSKIAQYQQGIKTMTANIWSHEKEWYYYRLLRLACPLMKEVCAKEGEFNAEEAVSLCGQTWKLLDDFNRESKKYQFRWIAHQDEVSMKSEQICVDFIEGEADWPGLYLYTLDNQEKFICITPGRISAE